MTQSLPEMLQERPVHVIGQGSLGCPIGENLFRKGVPELHFWDFDVVEARNRLNQRFFACDVNEKKPVPKVAARARILREIYPDSATKIVLHQKRLVPGTALEGIVISAVDWNRIRYHEVWPCVKDNQRVTFFADGRVGLDGGVAYGLDPNNPNHIWHYEAKRHNYPDPENAEAQAACKSEFPMPENADAVAAAVLRRLSRWLDLEAGCTDPYDNFYGFQFIPQEVIVTEQWNEGTECRMHRIAEPDEDDTGNKE